MKRAVLHRCEILARLDLECKPMMLRTLAW